MAKTDVHCTKCGKELEPWEDVVIVASGHVAPVLDDTWWSAQESDSPYLEVLCSACRELKPNRVVVELRKPLSAEAAIMGTRAVRPDEVCIIVKGHGDVVVYGLPGGCAIGKLNAVKVEPGEPDDPPAILDSWPPRDELGRLLDP